MIEIAHQSISRMVLLGRLFATSQETLTPLVRRGMARAMSRAMTEYRRTVSGKFKVQRSKVGNSFKWFVAGDTLNTVRAGAFTRWVAAPVYEEGLRITGKGAMAIPINRRAYTAQGRVKKKWRDPRAFKDLFQLTTRRGVVLLVQGKKQVRTAGMSRRVGVDVGQYRAWDPMFVLMPSTRRRAVLQFFNSMTRALEKTDRIAADVVDVGMNDAMERALR